MSLAKVIGLKPSEGDTIDWDCFKCLHLVYFEYRCLFARSKLKTTSSPGNYQPEYIYNDAGAKSQ